MGSGSVTLHGNGVKKGEWRGSLFFNCGLGEKTNGVGSIKGGKPRGTRGCSGGKFTWGNNWDGTTERTGATVSITSDEVDGKKLLN